MHPIPCFRAPLTPGVGVQGRNYFKNLSTIKIYNCAKFHPDWSDSLAFYKVRTYIYIYIFCALYIRFLLSIFFSIFSTLIFKSNFWDFFRKKSHRSRAWPRLQSRLQISWFLYSGFHKVFINSEHFNNIITE